MKPRSSRLGLYGTALRFAVPAVAACVAAVLAHVAIDAAGDYLLSHDAYDAPVHGSRWLASLVALGLAGCGLWALLRATLAEVRGSYGALRTVLRRALPRSRPAFVAVVVAATAPTLLAMAYLDASISGGKIDELGDLFGGSIVLGAGIALVVAIAVAAVALRVLVLLLRFHRELVRAVEIFVRLVTVAASTSHDAAFGGELRPRVAAALVRATRGNRAPPIRLTGITPA